MGCSPSKQNVTTPTSVVRPKLAHESAEKTRSSKNEAEGIQAGRTNRIHVDPAGTDDVKGQQEQIESQRKFIKDDQRTSKQFEGVRSIEIGRQTTTIQNKNFSEREQRRRLTTAKVDTEQEPPDLPNSSKTVLNKTTNAFIDLSRDNGEEKRRREPQITFKNSYAQTERNDGQECNNQISVLQHEVKELRFERDAMAGVNISLNEKISRLETEIKELRIRLSRTASNRLTDNNPNIADLSDPNRAAKLAERFSELYCNEWSSAYEELSHGNKRSEEKTVIILLEVIKGIYRTCFRIAETQENDLKSQLKLYTGIKFSKEMSEALTPFKDMRKKTYRSVLPTIRKEINTHIDLEKLGVLEHSDALQKYMELSTELCWLMCIQDPKVHLHAECKANSKFDYTSFAAYTVSGVSVDFLVWPALHLFKDGPLLCKGVAQGKGEKLQLGNK